MSAGPRAALLAALALWVAALGCGSTPSPAEKGGGSGGSSATGGKIGTLGAGGTLAAGGSLGAPQGSENSPTTRKTITLGAVPDTNVDVLFVVMDWAGDPESQSKLYDQLPLLVNVLKMPTTPLDLHIAVVTADMGVSGDTSGATTCTPHGDDGAFQSRPRGTCTDTTLAAGATFLADDGRGTTNFTGLISDVLQCIFLPGNDGCAIPQPLAAAERALGADDITGGCRRPPRATRGSCVRTRRWRSSFSPTRTTARRRPGPVSTRRAARRTWRIRWARCRTTAAIASVTSAGIR